MTSTEDVLTQLQQHCIDCRDEGINTPADVILWGHLFSRQATGPKCMDCARQWMTTDPHTLDMSAVFDLRPIRRALGIDGAS